MPKAFWKRRTRKWLLNGCTRYPNRDVKVIGYDGIQNNKLFHPVLSTIRQSVEEMARTSVKLLLRKIEGEKLEQETYRIPVTYRAGETT